MYIMLTFDFKDTLVHLFWELLLTIVIALELLFQIKTYLLFSKVFSSEFPVRKDPLSKQVERILRAISFW